jgi:hypothetical protein
MTRMCTDIHGFTKRPANHGGALRAVPCTPAS